jgi:uncharacterized beta-barrel protein YwiB (DUF1934 family)
MKGEEDQVMELMTEGKYYVKNDSRYFVYEETEVSGMSGDKTMLKFADNKVVMHRYGQNNSELCFQEGKRYEAAYETPYGPFEMEVLASKVFFEVDEEGGGNIQLVYELSIKGVGETKTTMSITSRALGGE